MSCATVYHYLYVVLELEADAAVWASELAQSGARNHWRAVDLWILDVEGYEMQVLQGTNFSEVGGSGVDACEHP